MRIRVPGHFGRTMIASAVSGPLVPPLQETGYAHERLQIVDHNSVHLLLEKSSYFGARGVAEGDGLSLTPRKADNDGISGVEHGRPETIKCGGSGVCPDETSEQQNDQRCYAEAGKPSQTARRRCWERRDMFSIYLRFRVR